MERKVLIDVSRISPHDDYAVLDIRLADQDRTPLLRLRVRARELGGALYGPSGFEPLTDGEIVAR